MLEIILPDLQNTEIQKWWLGRKLKVRIHLGIYLLQQIYLQSPLVFSITVIPPYTKPNDIFYQNLFSIIEAKSESDALECARNSYFNNYIKNQDEIMIYPCQYRILRNCKTGEIASFVPRDKIQFIKKACPSDEHASDRPYPSGEHASDRPYPSGEHTSDGSCQSDERTPSLNAIRRQSPATTIQGVPSVKKFK